MQYGFDVNKFFQSDYFQRSVQRFKAAIAKGVDEYIPQYIEQHKSEQASALTTDISSGNQLLSKEVERYAKAIKNSLELIDSTQCNDKYYKLVDFNVKVESSKITEGDIVQENSKLYSITEESDGSFSVVDNANDQKLATFYDKNIASEFVNTYPTMLKKISQKNTVFEKSKENKKLSNDEIAEAELDKKIEEALESIY